MGGGERRGSVWGIWEEDLKCFCGTQSGAELPVFSGCFTEVFEALKCFPRS